MVFDTSSRLQQTVNKSGKKKKLKSQNTFVFHHTKKDKCIYKANIKLSTTILKIPVDIMNAGLADNKSCKKKWTHQCRISFIVKEEYNFSHMEKL